MTSDDATRIHERLDTLLTEQAKANKTLAKVEARCEPCSKMVDAHQKTLHGNGDRGLKTEVASLTAKVGALPEDSPDTVSIKGMVLLIGAMAAAIGGTIAALVP